jgi:ribonuclease HI
VTASRLQRQRDGVGNHTDSTVYAEAKTVSLLAMGVKCFQPLSTIIRIEHKQMNKIIIHFDGGCKPTNPGNKYGSYEVSFNGRQVALISRVELGWGTNNEAEFEIFETSLKWTLRRLMDSGNTPDQFMLEAFSDSTIVVNRLMRRTTSGKKEPQHRMANCCAKCLNYTKTFADFKAFWNGRKTNVDKFGH